MTVSQVRHFVDATVTPSKSSEKKSNPSFLIFSKILSLSFAEIALDSSSGVGVRVTLLVLVVLTKPLSTESAVLFVIDVEDSAAGYVLVSFKGEFNRSNLVELSSFFLLNFREIFLIILLPLLMLLVLPLPLGFCILRFSENAVEDKSVCDSG